MQMDFSLPCSEEGKDVTSLLFLPGSLLSRQPPVKMRDHHSFSLYRHNVPHPHCLTISYTLKFMTSSQCRNWFSMLRFPFCFLKLTLVFISDEYVVLNVCTQFKQFNYIWCHEVLFDGMTMNKQWKVTEPAKWTQFSSSTLKCHNKCTKVIQARSSYCLCQVPSL